MVLISANLLLKICILFKVHSELRSDSNFGSRPLCLPFAIGICSFWTAAFGIITAICMGCVRFCMQAAKHIETCQYTNYSAVLQTTYQIEHLFSIPTVRWMHGEHKTSNIPTPPYPAPFLAGTTFCFATSSSFSTSSPA